MGDSRGRVNVHEEARARAQLMELIARYDAETWHLVSVSLGEDFTEAEDGRTAASFRIRSDAAAGFATLRGWGVEG